MTRQLATGLVVLSCVVAAAGAAQAPEVPNATDEHGGFGLADLAGTHLLVLPELARPDALGSALCSGGERATVRFTRRQPEDTNNGRQTPSNFDKLAGNLYDVAGRVNSNSICFVASVSLLKGSRVVPVAAAPTGPGGCVDRQRLAQARSRAVVHCYPIALVDGRVHVVLVEFERRGTDALASLVLVDGRRAVFDDHEAEYRGPGSDLWRVDDGGRLSPEGFQLVAALRRGAQWMLAVSWSGTEGESLSFLVANQADRFTTVLRDYWYQVPV